jgi:hypothetical protein
VSADRRLARGVSALEYRRTDPIKGRGYFQQTGKTFKPYLPKDPVRRKNLLERLRLLEEMRRLNG